MSVLATPGRVTLNPGLLPEKFRFENVKVGSIVVDEVVSLGRKYSIPESTNTIPPVPPTMYAVGI